MDGEYVFLLYRSPRKSDLGDIEEAPRLSSRVSDIETFEESIGSIHMPWNMVCITGV
jgi:hypothetical protein